VHEQSLPEIFASPRAQELRRLVLSTADNYCAAIGKTCPLKNIPCDPAEPVSTEIRFLAIEPTTLADEHGIPLWFDFAHTWGRSRRHPDELRYLAPYLRPFTALPGEPRQGGW